MRMEFGFERTSCNCNECLTNCQHMPGFLIPADLERMIPRGADPFVWAEKQLLASPGALAMKDGQTFRIHTLVPAVKNDRTCIHLTTEGRCAIHEIAPFGCAFFDCQPERQPLSRHGLTAVMKAWTDPANLYPRLWNYLHAQGRKQRPPEELRARMRKGE